MIMNYSLEIYDFQSSDVQFFSLYRRMFDVQRNLRYLIVNRKGKLGVT